MTMGMANATNEAAAASALMITAQTFESIWVSASIALYPEVNHLPHHQDANRHPEPAATKHDVPLRLYKKKADIFRPHAVKPKHDQERQAADDRGGGFRFRRQ